VSLRDVQLDLLAKVHSSFDSSQVSLILNMDVRHLMLLTSFMMIVDLSGRVVNGELREGDETISLAKFESLNSQAHHLVLVQPCMYLTLSREYSSRFQVA